MDSFVTKKRALTEVPTNLAGLDNDALVTMVKRLAKERDDLAAEVAKKPKTAAVASAAGGAQASSAVDTKALLQRLKTKAVSAIKKTKHNDKRKPYTEVCEGVPTKAAALALLAGFAPRSDTARMTRWVLEAADVPRWLACERLVHPVAFDGKVWCIAGSRPQVYAWAGFEQLEVKWEQGSGLLTCKFRTYMAGSGQPSVNPHLLAFARGEDVDMSAEAQARAQLAAMGY